MNLQTQLLKILYTFTEFQWKHTVSIREFPILEDRQIEKFSKKREKYCQHSCPQTCVILRKCCLNLRMLVLFYLKHPKFNQFKRKWAFKKCSINHYINMKICVYWFFYSVCRRNYIDKWKRFSLTENNSFIHVMFW